MEYAFCTINQRKLFLSSFCMAKCHILPKLYFMIWNVKKSIYINRDVTLYTKVIILSTKRTLIRYKKKIFKLVLTGVTDYQKVNTTFPPSFVDNFYASLNILSSNQKDENQCILDVWNGGFAWNWENERNLRANNALLIVMSACKQIFRITFVKGRLIWRVFVNLLGK